MEVKELTVEGRNDLLRFISSIPIFYSLSQETLTKILATIHVVVASPNETIFTEGDPGDSFYMIKEGHVKVVRMDGDAELVMAVLDQGEGFGEMALLAGQPRSATVKALDECILVRVMAMDFKRLTLENQELLVQMNRLMAQRVSLLEGDTGHQEETKRKFKAAPRFEMDPTVLDLLLRLNEAAGGKGQVEHCKETAMLAREMAKILCPMVSDDVFYAGYLHEIGKVALPTQLVLRQRKGEPLTADEEIEFNNIWKHAIRILKPDRNLYESVRFLEFLARPTFEEMPLEAQIIQVAHEYLEFTSPHYRGLNEEAATVKMRSDSGKRYNPRVVAALEKIVEKFKNLKVEKQIKFIRQMNIALDVKDNYTLRHSYHVRVMALKIGERMDLDRRSMDLLHMACDMHDVGKIFVPAEILNAPRKLTPEEFEVMKRHPVFSAEFFEDIPGMKTLQAIIKHHHERFDGRGYPDGLKGDEIPLLSRVEVVADVWSALTTPRVYRVGSDGRQKAYTTEEAHDIMSRMQPGHFDPEIFRIFEDIVHDQSALAGAAWHEVATVDVDSPAY
ncbi:MAG: HD domain-containing protein [Proteobacteria bacterium]|nr:HD domain-containing protein [Pseudomonadota bacterium]